LPAPVLLDAILAATQLDPLLEEALGERADALRVKMRKNFRFVFDVDEGGESDDFEGTIPQALLLLNGPLVGYGSSALQGTTLAKVLAMPGGDAAKIEALYLRTLSRRPTPEETVYWERFVNAPREAARDVGPSAPPKAGGGGAGYAGERRLARVERMFPKLETPKQQAYEDVLAALLNASEFTFNH